MTTFDNWMKDPTIKHYYEKESGMKKLIILVGNIGSGKSTLVNDLVKLNYYVISRDAMRYCYDNMTQILTCDGWKYFQDLSGKEMVLSLNPITNSISWSQIKNVISYNHNGFMHSFRTSQIDFCTTLKHKHFVKVNNQPWKIQESGSFYDKNRVSFKKSGIWKGKKTKKFILPTVKYYHNQYNINKKKFKLTTKQIMFKKIPMEIWVRFLAWYLSEGCVSDFGKGQLVRITQSHSVNPKNCTTIDNILDEMPFHFNCNNDTYTICSKQLYTYLKQFGKSKDRFIPTNIKELPPKLLKSFLEHYCSGDGHIYTPTCFHISTYSMKMRDDLMEIGIKAGYAVNSLKDKLGWKVSFLNRIIHTSEKSKRIFEKIDIYNGNIYCVTAYPNHIVFVMRNGKTMWSGNSIGGGNYIFDVEIEKIIKKQALSLLRQMTMKHYNIVIDETNMSKAIREPLIDIAKKRKYQVISYVLPKLSKKESIRRRMLNNHGNTSKEAWGEVWDKFDAMYEEPTEDEGFDQIHYKLK